MSLPPRERGLKLKYGVGGLNIDGVAPPAGAWIETAIPIVGGIFATSLPPRERGLKLAA